MGMGVVEHEDLADVGEPQSREWEHHLSVAVFRGCTVDGCDGVWFEAVGFAVGSRGVAAAAWVSDETRYVWAFAGIGLIAGDDASGGIDCLGWDLMVVLPEGPYFGDGEGSVSKVGSKYICKGVCVDLFDVWFGFAGIGIRRVWDEPDSRVLVQVVADSVDIVGVAVAV